jgi:hypothetical protein
MMARWLRLKGDPKRDTFISFLFAKTKSLLELSFWCRKDPHLTAREGTLLLLMDAISLAR